VFTKPFASIDRGYVFALLDQTNVTQDQIKMEMQGLDSLKAAMHLECMRDFPNMKYMRNLGSKLE